MASRGSASLPSTPAALAEHRLLFRRSQTQEKAIVVARVGATLA